LVGFIVAGHVYVSLDLSLARLTMLQRVHLSLSVFLILFASLIVSQPGAPIEEPVSRHSLPLDNSNWHAGSDVSTDDYEITYTESADDSGDVGIQFSQEMTIEYKDGTGATASFLFQSGFNEGGIDLDADKVTDWSKSSGIYPHSKMTTYNEAGQKIETLTGYWGFSFFKGNANDFSPQVNEWGRW